jgi:hypothetical protein
MRRDHAAHRLLLHVPELREQHRLRLIRDIAPERSGGDVA